MLHCVFRRFLVLWKIVCACTLQWCHYFCPFVHPAGAHLGAREPRFFRCLLNRLNLTYATADLIAHHGGRRLRAWSDVVLRPPVRGLNQ